jgi:hypothetical protein
MIARMLDTERVDIPARRRREILEIFSRMLLVDIVGSMRIDNRGNLRCRSSLSAIDT